MDFPVRLRLQWLSVARLLSALKDVRDRLRVPMPSASRGNPARIQGLRKLPEGPCARLLGLADDREHVGRVALRLRLHGSSCGPREGYLRAVSTEQMVQTKRGGYWPSGGFLWN
jgi:hypothetical protein